MTNIKFDAHNYRTHDEKNLKLIKKSLKELGAGRSIVIDAEGEIIAGNATYKQAQELGLPIKVIESDGKSLIVVKRTDLKTQDKKRKKLALADNSTSDKVQWDFDHIAADFDLSELPDWGIEGLPDMAPVEPVEEDDVPEVSETTPRTKKGDIWLLGEHRLMCGDSTSATDVEKLMNGAKADMVFTDPPYGMKKEKDGVLNDNQNQDDLLEFNKQWIPLSFAFLKDIGSWYCWGTDTSLMDIYAFILRPYEKENKITFRNLLTWDKGSGQGQNSKYYRMYPIADEKCLFVMAGVQGFNNNADNYFEGWEPIRQYLIKEKEKLGLNNKELTFHLNNTHTHYWTTSQWLFPTREHYIKLQELAKKNNKNAFQKEYDELKKEYDELKKEYDELKKEWYSTRSYFNNTHDNMNNVWHFERASRSERELTGGHATPKPIALCSRGIKTSSQSGDIVLDLFGGSGSTLIACEKLDRKCYMMELDPHFCDVIITRWETLTGKQARLLEA